MSSIKARLWGWIEKWILWRRGRHGLRPRLERDTELELDREWVERERERVERERKRVERERVERAELQTEWVEREDLQMSKALDDEIRLQRLSAGWLQCEACGEARPPTDFDPDRRTPTGRDQSSCRECRAR